MSALMIATITVRDPGKFQEYLARTREVALPFGAELLFRGKAGRSLTGHGEDHGLAVIVRFPSLGKIDEWIASDAYQPLIPLRKEAADMKMTSYEVMD